MIRYIARRIVAMIPVLFLVSLVVFVILRITPGDPAVIMLGEEATPQSVAALRQELGLNRPVWVQYLDWLSHVLRGDLGHSIWTHQPVVQAVLQRLPVTIELTILAMIVSLVIAAPAGIISATRRNSAADVASTTFTLLGLSMPNFFLAVLLIFVFSLYLRLLPPMGYTPIQQGVLPNLQGMALPALALGIPAAAIVARLLRSTMLEVLNQDYVRTARAKGLPERSVINVHALRNALIPVVTALGLQVGVLLGGAVITETIFVLPGVGALIVSSIFERDLPLVQGAVLFVALAHLLVNLAVDVTYAFLDPQIQLG